MELKKIWGFVLFTVISFGSLAGGGRVAAEQNLPFPSYGSGPVEVRVYSDYFCPPCRAVEPEMEPLLINLLKKKSIRLVLVDVPYHPLTSLYARYFLYALKANNDPELALKVRYLLFEISLNDVKTGERIEAIFKEKGIDHGVWDPKPAFDRYNALLKEDKIKATPTCVIVKNGQKTAFVGGTDILAALKALP